jgi:hypothetical protein
LAGHEQPTRAAKLFGDRDFRRPSPPLAVHCAPHRPRINVAAEPPLEITRPPGPFTSACGHVAGRGGNTCATQFSTVVVETQMRRQSVFMSCQGHN